MYRLAIVTGTSERGYPLYKQLIASWSRNIKAHNEFIIDLYPYMCNFKILNKNIMYALDDKSINIEDSWFTYSNVVKMPNFSNDFPFWNGNIVPQICTHNSFPHFYLPDIALYQDFTNRFLDKYDYVIFTHNDIVMKKDNLVLYDIHETLCEASPYSIIARPTLNCDKTFSFRFCTFFYAISTQKFLEQGLSFINQLELVDAQKYYVYFNGGSGLFNSFYLRRDESNSIFKPYTDVRWVEHKSHIEFRRVEKDMVENILDPKTPKELKIIQNCLEDQKKAERCLKEAQTYYDLYYKELQNANI